jgi:hypothetical protein
MTNRHALILSNGVPTEMAATDTILGNVSGTAATVTGAAQAAITSVGTLTGLTEMLGTGAGTVVMASILASAAAQTLNSGTGETTLITYTLPANSLVTTGQTLIYVVTGQWTNTANAKNLKTYLGSTVMKSTTLPINTAGTYLHIYFITRTSASHQNYSYCEFRTVSGGNVQANGSSSTATETETSDIIIKTTGTGGASSEISVIGNVIFNGLGN